MSCHYIFGVGVCVWLCFFFQAEDGIRDLVRSRGLGDVYKRQRVGIFAGKADVAHVVGLCEIGRRVEPLHRRGGGAVSYTHLTLPTSDLV